MKEMAKATGHMHQEAPAEYKSKLAKAVGATEKRHPMYKDVLVEIKRRPEKDYLTKAEGIDLSQAFYG